MKDILLAFAVIVFCGFFSSQIFAANPDIYCRPALYFGGTLVKDNAMNKDSVFVTPDKPIEISKSASYLQQNGFYYFKGGYFLNIKSEQNALSTMLFYNAISHGASQDAILQIKPKPEDKNIVGYTNGIWSIAVRQNIGLKDGVNHITLKLDSNNVIKESNEQNNTYNFKVTLKP